MNQVGTASNNCKEDPQIFLNTLDPPTLLMQAEPRQVISANDRACELFGKDLAQIEGYRGGQVFDCVHSFTEAGCGKDPNCEDCKIKNAVVETFASGNGYDVQVILDIKKHNEITPYDMQISTVKIGDFVLITIDKYREKFR